MKKHRVVEFATCAALVLIVLILFACSLAECAELKPNDPTHDNSPAIVARIVSDGICELGPGSYHVSGIVIPEGVCGILRGVSGGYRNVHAGLTQLRPTEDWDGSTPLLTWSAPQENRATARGVEVSRIRFIDNLANNEATRRLGVGLRVLGADVLCVEKCSFWGFDVAAECGSAEQPLCNLTFRDCQFIQANRGIRTVSGVPTIALISVVNCHFLQCGVDDPDAPGGGLILKGGAAHLVELCRFEDNHGRGCLLHDTKHSEFRNNYCEDNAQGNLIVTASSAAASSVLVGTNSFDAGKWRVVPPARVFRQCVSEQ